MATGRKYILRHVQQRNRINRFTYEDYNGVCADIIVANPATNKKNVIVKHAKNKMAAVATVIKSVLGKNNIKVAGYEKYASTNVKTLFKFNSKEDARKAVDIINNMATPDSINPSKIQTNGDVVSNYGVKLNVDVELDPNGNVVASQGGNYVSSNSQTSGELEESGINWYLIGGAALIGVILILAIVKLAKKK